MGNHQAAYAAGHRASGKLPPPGNGPFVPAHVVWRLVAPFCDRDGISAVARRAGMDERRLRQIRDGSTYWTSLWIADKLLTRVCRNPHLWLTTPELRPFYEHDGQLDIADAA